MLGYPDYFEHKKRTFINSNVSIDYLFLPKKGKETIIFLHDIATDLRYFWPNIVDLKEDYQVLTYSLRGHGKSSIPMPIHPENFSIQMNTWDLASLLDYIKVEEFHLVGHGIGGVIGLELLSTVPERFLSCSLVSTNAVLKIPKWLNEILSGMSLMAFGIGGRDFERSFFKNMSKNKFTHKYMRRFKLPDKSLMSVIRKAFSNYSYEGTLKSTACPILYLVGKNDEEYKNLEYTIYLLEENQDAYIQYAIMKSTGRLLNLDDAEKFAMLLSNFINSSKEYRKILL